jgi:hypothetical protein
VRAVHGEVLDAARSLTGAARGWTFRLADLVRALPHLNPGTVRTHVASRCCVNAPPHHQTRYRYFRCVGRGLYRLEPAFRRPPRRERRPAAGWQDRLLATMESGVDPTLVIDSLRRPPTERLQSMERAARSLDAMVRR